MNVAFVRFGPALASIALGSCENGGSGPVASLSLTSAAFRDGGPIPAEFTCDGVNRSPPLSWGGAPAGTKSFAVIVDDPDAPGGTFRHWGAYDIPAGIRSIAGGQTVGKNAVNDFNRPGYGGPCPPSGTHHYHFKLYALDVDKLELAATPNVADVENEANKHALAHGELVGTYKRK